MSRNVALSLAVAMLLPGCAAIKGGDRPTTLRLNPDPQPASVSKSADSVAIVPVRGRGFAAQTRLTYIEEENPAALNQAKTLFWEEPPPKVVERALVQGLQTRFSVITGRGALRRADRRVQVTLSRFEEISGARARAVVAIDGSVLKDMTTMVAGHWCASVPIASRGSASRALAFSKALYEVIGRFVQAPDGANSVDDRC